MLIGNGPDAMHRVSMVGNDMKLDTGIGMCGKAGQGVPVGVGQPHLRMNQDDGRRDQGLRPSVRSPPGSIIVLTGAGISAEIRHLDTFRDQGRHLVEGRLSRGGDAAGFCPQPRQGARVLQHAPAAPCAVRTECGASGAGEAGAGVCGRFPAGDAECRHAARAGRVAKADPHAWPA